MIGLLWFLAPKLINPSSSALVPLIAVSTCLLAPLTEQTARVFQTFGRMRMTAGINILTNLVRTVAAMGLQWRIHHATASQWAVAFTAVSVVSAGVSVAAVIVLYGGPRFVPSLLLKHGAEGLGYSFASSTVAVYNDIDKTMLSHFGLNAANGIYTIAYRVVDMATIPVYAVREAVLSRFFQAGRARILESREISYRLLKRTFPLCILIATGMFAAAPLIPWVLGPGFSEAATALRWLSLIPVLRSVHVSIGSVLTGAGLQNYRTIAQVSSAALNLGLNLWAIPHFGWTGAAWASLITDGALCMLTWGILYKVILKTEMSTQGQPA
jgi:O-antigen/teichoic acid export membrane protein